LKSYHQTTFSCPAFGSANIALTSNVYAVVCHIVTDGKELIIPVKKWSVVFVWSFVETEKFVQKLQDGGERVHRHSTCTHR
jgi:hypothetical protein